MFLMAKGRGGVTRGELFTRKRLLAISNGRILKMDRRIIPSLKRDVLFNFGILIEDRRG